MDKDQVIRLQGRLDKAELIPLQTRRPIILDSKHLYTRLLIRWYHEKNMHVGQETVVNELRQNYWLLDIRTAVRSCWNSCQVCKNGRAKPVNPFMGNIPDCRLENSVRPFTASGMDYFGPFPVKIQKKTQKRYGVIFTCMTTRAVHIEVAENLTTDSCLMAIRRFFSRRGTPRKLMSDNKTNFRGAAKELQEAVKSLDHFRVSTELSSKSIEWSFLPPGAPHMGGCWERLIRSIKTAISKTLNSRTLKEEAFNTLLVEAESIYLYNDGLDFAVQRG